MSSNAMRRSASVAVRSAMREGGFGATMTPKSVGAPLSGNWNKATEGYARATRCERCERCARENEIYRRMMARRRRAGDGGRRGEAMRAIGDGRSGLLPWCAARRERERWMTDECARGFDGK
jgi:hypothetical protein